MGALTRGVALGGDQTITWSGNLIVSTTQPTEQTLRHERGHIAQVQPLGPFGFLYLPMYVTLAAFVPVNEVIAFAGSGRFLPPHDAHLMEWDANMRSGVGNTWYPYRWQR